MTSAPPDEPGTLPSAWRGRVAGGLRIIALPFGLLACAVSAPAQSADPPNLAPPRANFGAEQASTDVRKIVEWVVASGDNRGLPFIVVDKVGAKVFAFDRRGQMLGAAPALLGLARGDDSVPGIGQRKLATITPSERTTPAGRFEAVLGNDFEQDLLWVDYDAALSLHRVIVGRPADRRYARLASRTPLDNRITYGCINVPARFYDAVVAPAFKGTVGIVYILPESEPVEAVFAMREGLGGVPFTSRRAPTATPKR